jgi:hypothetical protein
MKTCLFPLSVVRTVEFEILNRLKNVTLFRLISAALDCRLQSLGIYLIRNKSLDFNVLIK